MTGTRVQKTLVGSHVVAPPGKAVLGSTSEVFVGQIYHRNNLKEEHKGDPGDSIKLIQKGWQGDILTKEKRKCSEVPGF